MKTTAAILVKIGLLNYDFLPQSDIVSKCAGLQKAVSCETKINKPPEHCRRTAMIWGYLFQMDLFPTVLLYSRGAIPFALRNTFAK